MSHHLHTKSTRSTVHDRYQNRPSDLDMICGFATRPDDQKEENAMVWERLARENVIGVRCSGIDSRRINIIECDNFACYLPSRAWKLVPKTGWPRCHVDLSFRKNTRKTADVKVFKALSMNPSAQRACGSLHECVVNCFVPAHQTCRTP